MSLEDLALLSRRGRMQIAAFACAIIFLSVWASVYLLKPSPPRRIVMATGLEDGLYHQHAQRYKAVLGRAGIIVEERLTSGAEENLKLLRDPRSGVDIAFTQGGIATELGEIPDDPVVMLASLHYEPMWVFYRDALALRYVNELRGLKVSNGVAGSGTRALANAIFALNELDAGAVTTVPLSNTPAIEALSKGEIDAAIVVGGAETAAVSKALRTPGVRLLSFGHADAYHRRLAFIVRLTLPSGAIDPGRDLPPQDVQLIGTKAMLIGRNDLHPALVNLLIDAARDIHSKQGFFEEAGDFPSTSPVDIPVSADADRHKRFGSTFLYNYLPFWLAALAERAMVILLPIAAILFPLFSYLPQFLRWRVRSRVYRWYGELALLEREIATRKGPAPIERWMADLDRIEHAVAGIYTPTEFASEAYTLRQHVDFVRQAVRDHKEKRADAA